jgi:hypothetical protein
LKIENRESRMSPNGQIRGAKVIARDNLYTVLLAVAVAVVLATAAFVAYECYSQYGTFFRVP